MEEDDVALPLRHPDRDVAEPRQLLGERRQLVIVGGEEGAAAVRLVQVLDRRPGDGEAVEGGGAAADLVEDDQRARPRLVEDRRGLDHLDHEGRAAAGEIVGGADAAEQAVDDAEPRPLRRHIGADLGEDGDEGVLAEERRLAGHVRPSHQPNRSGIPGIPRPEVAIVGDEGLAVGAERLLDHRMAAAFDGEGERSVDLGPAIALGLGENREGGGDVEHGERLGDRADGLGRIGDRLRELVEDREFDGERPFAGAGDPRLEVGELGGGEADGAGHGLAVDETGVLRRRQEAFGVVGADLDEIAEHVVVLDLQTANLGLAGVARLQAGNHPAALVAEPPRLVELGVVAVADEAAVALQMRQIWPERGGEGFDQPGRRRGDGGRRRGDLLGEGAVQPAGDPPGGGETVADGGEIARAAAVEGEPRQRPGEVGRGGEVAAEPLSEPGVGEHEGDRVEAAGDEGGVGRGTGETAGEQPGAGAGDRAVDRRDQAAAPLAGEGRGELEIGPRRRVDQHDRAGGFGRGRRQRRPHPDLGLLDIGERGGGGGELGPREAAEAVEGLHAETVGEAPFGGGAVEEGRRQRRHRGGEAAPERRQRRIGEDRVGDDDLARLDAGEVGGEPAAVAPGDAELAGRDVDPGDGEGVGAVGAGAAQPRHGGEEVVAARRKERVLGQGAGRDQADDVAAHHRLAAAFPRFGRVLGLLADGDAMTEGDQLLQILVGGVDGDAAHRNVVALVPAALGEGDAEGPAGDLGVLEEHLVEIAHPVEQEAIRIGGLDLDVLRHHRRGGGRRLGLFRGAGVHDARKLAEGARHFTFPCEMRDGGHIGDDFPQQLTF